MTNNKEILKKLDESSIKAINDSYKRFPKEILDNYSGVQSKEKIEAYLGDSLGFVKDSAPAQSPAYDISTLSETFPTTIYKLYRPLVLSMHLKPLSGASIGAEEINIKRVNYGFNRAHTTEATEMSSNVAPTGIEFDMLKLQVFSTSMLDVITYRLIEAFSMVGIDFVQAIAMASQYIHDASKDITLAYGQQDSNGNVMYTGFYNDPNTTVYGTDLNWTTATPEQRLEYLIAMDGYFNASSNNVFCVKEVFMNPANEALVSSPRSTQSDTTVWDYFKKHSACSRRGFGEAQLIVDPLLADNEVILSAGQFGNNSAFSSSAPNYGYIQVKDYMPYTRVPTVTGWTQPYSSAKTSVAIFQPSSVMKSGNIRV